METWLSGRYSRQVQAESSHCCYSKTLRRRSRHAWATEGDRLPLVSALLASLICPFRSLDPFLLSTTGFIGLKGLTHDLFKATEVQGLL